MKLPKTIHAVDLFCGAGGTSTGLAQACKALGVDVDLVAINHWTTAVNSHAKNHPWARHLCVPVESVNPREAMPGGVVHILCASPECTHHSTARGGKPTSDQLRASAWHIMRWVNELDVRNILIENVPEFEGWGPVSQKTGRPIKRDRGKYFRAFVDALSNSGYAVAWKVLNAADYGAATSRRRLFLIARKGKRVPAWPDPTHSKGGKVPGTKRWRAAREVIDWSLQGRSIFDREKPLADKTVQRIMVGLEKHGGPALKPFLVLLRGGDAKRSSQSVEAPVPTLTANGEHVAVAEPFLLSQGAGGAPRAVSDPAPTIVGGGAVALVDPVLVDTFGSKDCWPARGQPVDQPLPTVAGNGRWGVAEPIILPPDGPGGNGQHNHAKPVSDPMPTIRASRDSYLVQPVLVQYNGASDASPVSVPVPTQPTHDRFGLVEPFIITTDRLDTNRSLPRPVSEPVPTVVASNDRIGLAEAFLVPNFGERDGQEPRTHSVRDPVPTVTSHGAGALVEPHILAVTHGGLERSIEEPLPTITGANRGELALVQPVIDGKKLDIRFRMLQPHELALAMGFPAGYVFEGSRRDMVKQVGNAVEVNQSRSLILGLIAGGLNPQARLDLQPDSPEVA